MHIANGQAGRTFSGRLFAGHASMKWLCACFMAVYSLRVSKLMP